MKSGENKPKVLITGGHLTPALAVAEELEERIGKDHLIWVGTKYTTTENTETSAEFNTISRLGFRFVNLNSGKLFRKWNKFTIKSALYNLYLIPVGFVRAAKIIYKEQPDIVMSFGGYLAVPICFWARLKSIKVYTHEQTLTTGLANKIVARFSSKVFVSWKENLKDYSEDKAVFTGNPLPDIFKKAYKLPQKKLFNNDLITIMITGGNQGSHRINEAVKPILLKLLRNCNVIHQSGNTSPTYDYTELKKLEEKFKDMRGKYLVYDYDSTIDHALQMRNSDLVISRAGANTITVLSLYKQKAILIPIPWSSKNEQLLNAKYYEKTGLGTVLEQDKLTPDSLLTLIEQMLNQNNSLTVLKEIAIPLDAEIKICDILLGD